MKEYLAEELQDQIFENPYVDLKIEQGKGTSIAIRDMGGKRLVNPFILQTKGKGFVEQAKAKIQSAMMKMTGNQEEAKRVNNLQLSDNLKALISDNRLKIEDKVMELKLDLSQNPPKLIYQPKEFSGV